MKIETLAVHAGETHDLNAGAIVPPITLSTTFERSADGGYPSGFHYARSANPNRTALETCLAALEEGAACACFSSGMAAVTAMLQALEPGDHVVICRDVYYGVVVLVRELLARWGLEVTYADFTDPAAVAAAMGPRTRLVWGETPTNPLLRIVDIDAIIAIAHDAGATIAFDNTFATPVAQQPLARGADIVMHSATKYLNGHSDVVAGAIVAREESPYFERVRLIQQTAGAVPSAFDCWLTMRGIKTLPYRMRAHAEGAAAVARFLAGRSGVARVRYPGLADDPGHATAARQMRSFGGMLAFEVDGGAPEAMAVASRVRLFTRATSLGGVHSLIEHRASVEAPGTTTPQNLLRVSVGLEHPDDLIADLDQALG